MLCDSAAHFLSHIIETAIFLDRLGILKQVLPLELGGTFVERREQLLPGIRVFALPQVESLKSHSEDLRICLTQPIFGVPFHIEGTRWGKFATQEDDAMRPCELSVEREHEMWRCKLLAELVFTQRSVYHRAGWRIGWPGPCRCGGWEERCLGLVCWYRRGFILGPLEDEELVCIDIRFSRCVYGFASVEWEDKGWVPPASSEHGFILRHRYGSTEKAPTGTTRPRCMVCRP
jgi:hypothetical protein